MTNADWWKRVVEARTEHDDRLTQKREAAINLRPVPGVGPEVVLSVDGQ